MSNQPIVLNVAEKPSVARAISSVFSQQGRTAPISSNSNIFISKFENISFPNVFLQNPARTSATNNHINIPAPAMIQHTMITTSVRGHLASTEFPSEFGWNSCPPLTLFSAPIDTYYKQDMVPIKNLLQTQSRYAQALILWLDCDREGEAIADEVRSVCLESNPNLCVKRARFSTLIPLEIRRSLNQLDVVNENFVQAVKARMELDLRVGASFTRFQTMRLQKRFDLSRNGSTSVISYGPCQFPTLGFVVERWARIETFIPEEFWFLEMKIQPNTQAIITAPTTEPNNKNPSLPPAPTNNNHAKTITLTWRRQRLFDRVCTMALYHSCLCETNATVKSLIGRPKNKWRPIPLATVEFQKRAAKYLRIGSETLMTAAEELYQQGFISYPRTETERFRPEFQHMPLIESLRGCEGDIGNYVDKLLRDNNYQSPRNGPNDDNAHPPITPCKAVNPQSITDPVQRKIYELVVKHYLACCSRDAIGKETELVLKMASEEFVAKGLMIIERNWLEIYHPWERWSVGQGELPTVEVGSRIKPLSLMMKEGRTTAPLPLSEVELISLMDRNKIGTDATIAQHISTIQDRNYAQKDSAQRFHPTKLGIALVEGYNSMGYQLNKPELRRETEHECNLVALGQKSKEDIMQPLLEKMRLCFVNVNAEAHKLDAAIRRHFIPLGSATDGYRVINQNNGQCGVCQANLILKQQNNTSTNASNSNSDMRRRLLFCPSCAQGYPLPGRGEISLLLVNQNPATCPICQFNIIQVSRGEGYQGNGYKLCPKCYLDPPAEHGGETTAHDFACFKCSHPSCTFATGIRSTSNIVVYGCPFCDNGNVMLKRTQKGFLLSCTHSRGSYGQSNNVSVDCNYVVWLPRESSEVTVPNSNSEEETSHQIRNQNISSEFECSRCTNNSSVSRHGVPVRKLKFIWKPNSVPLHVDREYIGCVLCDEFLKIDMRVKLPLRNNQVRIHNHRGGRGRTNGRSGGRDPGGGRGRGRGRHR